MYLLYINLYDCFVKQWDQLTGGTFNKQRWRAIFIWRIPHVPNTNTNNDDNQFLITGRLTKENTNTKKDNKNFTCRTPHQGTPSQPTHCGFPRQSRSSCDDILDMIYDMFIIYHIWYVYISWLIYDIWCFYILTDLFKGHLNNLSVIYPSQSQL